MTKKKILRKVWKVCFAYACGYLFYITIRFLIGKADIASTIVMFACYLILALCLIFCIVYKITQKVRQYSAYISLVVSFKYLQSLYKRRYKIYFAGDRKKVEEYSTEIERCGNSILEGCNIAISTNLLSKKHIPNAKEIINQTEKLLTTTD